VITHFEVEVTKIQQLKNDGENHQKVEHETSVARNN
jgi:hypothetical protein